MPYYALRAAEVPRSVAVKEEDLTEPSSEKRTGLVFSVVYNTETVWLPDFSYLENLLKKSQVFSRLT